MATMLVVLSGMLVCNWLFDPHPNTSPGGTGAAGAGRSFNESTAAAMMLKCGLFMGNVVVELFIRTDVHFSKKEKQKKLGTFEDSMRFALSNASKPVHAQILVWTKDIFVNPFRVFRVFRG